MNTINVSVIETSSEIRIEVNGKLNSSRRIHPHAGQTGIRNLRNSVKLEAFDIVRTYSTLSEKNRVVLDWFNNF